MLFQAYKIYSVVSFVVLLAVFSLLVAPLGTGAYGLIALLAILGFPLMLLGFSIRQEQLDRHYGSIPLPGLLGAFYDLDKDDENRPTPGLGLEEGSGDGSPTDSTRPFSGERPDRSGIEFSWTPPASASSKPGFPNPFPSPVKVGHWVDVRGEPAEANSPSPDEP